jgi:hypothetical protein
MPTTDTHHKRKLPLLPTLVLCGAVLLLYKIFRSPELDKQIHKVIGNITEGG